MLSLRRVLFSAWLGLFSLDSALGAPSWVKVSTQEVVVYSDASPKDAVEIAVAYIGFRRAFEDVFAPATPLPPATMLVFRTLDGMHKYIPFGRVGGTVTTTVSTEVDGRVLLVLAVDGVRQTSLRQIYQFETVWALGRTGIRAPLWMSQGAGEVLESLRFKDGTLEIGSTADYTYPTSPLPWSEFFAMNAGMPAYRSGTSAFHEQAWGLMHRVLLGGDTPSKSFRKLADSVAKVGALAAVQQSLGTDEPGIGREILRHLRKGPRRRVPFEVEATRRRVVFTNADPIEVHVQLANLSLVKDAKDTAELELARALSVPGAMESPIFLEAQARSLLREQRTEDAIAKYRQAIAHGSTSPMTYVRSAEHRLRLSGSLRMEAGSGGTAADEAVVELERALQLDPDNHPAYVQLGRALFLRREVTAGDVAKLDRGVRHEALGSAVRYYRALVRLRLGQRAALAADLAHLLADPQCHPTTQKAAHELMANEVLTPAAKEVEQLATAGRFAEARAVISAFYAVEGGDALKGTFARLTLWLDESEAWAAVQAARRAKDMPALATATRAFLERFPASPAAERARRLLEAATSKSATETAAGG